MSVQGAFVAQLVRAGCHINVAQLISQQYPSVWKWFVYKWVRHSGNAKQFISKHLGTVTLRNSFMRKMAKHGFWNILQWAYKNGCNDFTYYGWTLILDNAIKGENTDIAKWVSYIQEKERREVLFLPKNFEIYTRHTMSQQKRSKKS